jgi:imidazolonepropionase-like amidohydrolase
MKMIKAGRIINGIDDGIYLDQAVEIDNGRIQSIYPWREDLGANNFLDFSNYTILPGYIDTHLHFTLDPADPDIPYRPDQPVEEIILRTVINAQSALKAGVTTVGDCGAENRIILPVREAINSGELTGPRILTSGNPIVPKGGHGAELGKIASGEKEVRQAVCELAEAGVDFIKVMATAGGGEDPGENHYSADELTALRQEAEKFDLVVAAHAHGPDGIRNCIRAGIQRIEHCSFFDGKEFLFDPAAAREIAAQNIIVSPTNVIDYRRWQHKEKGAPREELNKVWQGLLAAGVKFASSSDAGVTDIHYDDYALIPELMVAELGMTPHDAIQSCTSIAAEALQISHIVGSLMPGMTADLVVIEGNPLDDIQALRDVKFVFRNGNLVCGNL